jgi:putative aldouronate transport system permease protein
MGRVWQLYLLFLLPLLYVIIFKYIPMYGAQIAFKNYMVSKGFGGSEWVGIKYFSRFFNSYDFWRILKNTLSLSFYTLAVSFPIPIFLALSLNMVENRRFKNAVQLITYAPYFISLVVMVGLIMQFLNPRFGIVNEIIGWFGIEPVNFMGRPEWYQSIYVWSNVWQNAGFSCIIFLAVLSTIDPALHEAAVVDGASKMQRLRHIDLPGIMPIAIILLILNTGQMMETGFEKALLMQNTVNLRTSEIIDTYVYKIGLASQAMNFSYATAIGLFKSVISLILLLIVNYTAKKAGQESLW